MINLDFLDGIPGIEEFSGGNAPAREAEWCAFDQSWEYDPEHLDENEQQRLRLRRRKMVKTEWGNENPPDTKPAAYPR